MTRIVRKMIPSLLLMLLFAAGCSHAGSQSVGKWVNNKNANGTMEITRNGDQFLILVSHDKVGAIYKNGTLQVPSIMGAMAVTYVKSSDTLLTPGFFGQSEYKRTK